MASQKNSRRLAPLVDLGFTIIEAEVYALLLREAPATGYRISQALTRPIAHTYKVLESLEAKGAVVTDEGATRLYRAVPPEELLARLERTFLAKRSQAASFLSTLRQGAGDNRIYQIRDYEQVMERARQMLARAERKVLMDVFPEPLEELRTHLEDAAARDVEVLVEVYEPIRIKGVTTVFPLDPETSLARWPGQHLNLVVDAREQLLALLATGEKRVYQATYTGSTFLVANQHTLLATELLVGIIKERLDAGDDAAKLRAVFKANTDRVRLSAAPGYQAFIELAAPPPPDESPASVRQRRKSRTKPRQNA